MPRDMSRKSVYDGKWRKKNTVSYAVRFTNASGIPLAIDKASKQAGVPVNTIVRQAVVEKLQREGYLSGEGYPSGEGHLPRGSLSSEIKEALIDNDYIRENL